MTLRVNNCIRSSEPDEQSQRVREIITLLARTICISSNHMVTEVR